MSTCDNSFQEIQRLQEEKRQLQEQLAESERLRKAGKTFTSAEAGNQVILPGRDGTPRLIDTADATRGWQRLAADMDSPEVEFAVARGMGERAKPHGADGRFTNYDRLLEEVDASVVEDYARLTEALGVQWGRLAPEDYAFVTEVYGKDRLLEIAAKAYRDLGVTDAELAASMANDAARFSGTVESMARLRFLADRTKHLYLGKVKEASEFMQGLPGAKPVDALKQQIFRAYRLALASERHYAFARRRTAQTLRSLQDDMADTPLHVDLEGEEKIAEALGMTPADVKPGEHIARVMQAVDDGPEGQLVLDALVDGAIRDGLDPKGTLDTGWENIHLRIGNSYVKDSQLSNLNTQLKANLGSNVMMAFFGPVSKMMENGVILTPVGTRMSRELFVENAKIHAEAVQFSLDAIRSAGIGKILGEAFGEGKAHFGGNADTYGKHLRSNDYDIAEAQKVLDRPYESLGSPANFAIFRDKLQVAARILAYSLPDKAGPGRFQLAGSALMPPSSGKGAQQTLVPRNWRLPIKAGLRAMGAVDELFGRYQYLFHLKAQLEVRARTEGAQLGLLDEQDRAAWVQARIEEAIYQATPTEANIKTFRKQHGLKGSDITDDQIAVILAEQNMAGAPTMGTKESREAYEYSLWARMQNDPKSSEISWGGKPVETIDRGVMAARKSWVVDTFIPYWRSPFNQMLFDTRLSTFAALDMAKIIFGKDPSPEMIARTKAAWVMSGATLALFAALDANGQISGGSDPDPKKRNRIGGVPYLGGIPVFNTLFLWKDLKDAAIKAGESNFDGTETMTALTQVLTNQILRQTGIATLQQLVEALSGARAPGEAFRRFLGFTGAGQLPFIGVERNLERMTGTDLPSYFTDGSASPGQRYLLGDDSPLAKVERGLRDLAYNTLPAIAAATGAPRKTKDWLGSPIGHVWGIDLAKAFPFFPGAWPNDKVYGELDTQGQLSPPQALLTRTLDGVGMSDDLQAEYVDIYGSVKGASLVGRNSMIGKSVDVRFPMPVDVVLPSGVRIRKDGGATIPLGQFLEKHVKGKTAIEAFRSLFNDPIYKAMEADPMQSSDLSLLDQPKALRRSKPAQLMIQGIKDYYHLLTTDELERRAASDKSAAAQQWSQARSQMTQEKFRQSVETLSPTRGQSWLQDLINAVNPPQ